MESGAREQDVVDGLDGIASAYGQCDEDGEDGGAGRGPRQGAEGQKEKKKNRRGRRGRKRMRGGSEAGGAKRPPVVERVNGVERVVNTKPTLLEMLLEKEIHEESTVLLQAIRHIVSNSAIFTSSAVSPSLPLPVLPSTAAPPGTYRTK